MSELNECNCCEGIKKLTPVPIENAPGLASIKYRVGTHAQFKTSMLASLSEKAVLKGLTTRADNDLTIALIDAWATVADVLTFYQERIANEGFLRTATERRSILELARAIGYELRPGVAASTFLAFTIEEAGIEETIINKGTKVQSLPAANEIPQVFETIEEIKARPEWNELKPLMTKIQNIDGNTSKFYFKGVNLQLHAGDYLLVVDHSSPKSIKIISNVEEDLELERTIVDTIGDTIVSTNPATSETLKSVNTSKSISLSKSDSITTDLGSNVTSQTWSLSELSALSIEYNIPLTELYTAINYQTGAPSAQQGIKVYAFRIRANIFGHNAPSYKALPKDIKKEYSNWDNPISINTNSDGTVHNPANLIYLDNTYPDILPSTTDILPSTSDSSWIILKSPEISEKHRAYRILETREETMVDFTLSTKVTGLVVDVNDNNNELAAFKIRKTSVLAKSEELELADLPIEDPVEGKSITLDKAVEGLYINQLVAISGELLAERNMLIGLKESQIVTISNIELDKGYTKLTFIENLNKYKRDTVVINANVARATHGETKEEVLGSGDPSKEQEFILRQSPLTFVSAATASGSKSTLEVYVDNILWNEVSSLYNLKSEDHAYTLRIEDDGKVRVIFGDGIRGAKPSAGIENITAKYRIGIGMSGMLKKDQLSLLMTRPLGVRSVTNPLAPTGAEDPEDLEDARNNAPLTVLTMDRIVSLNDFENFARAFAGIGKAQAIRLWNGDKEIVHLTIASVDNENVDETSDLYRNLLDAINTYKDLVIPFTIGAFSKKSFSVKAKILVAADRDTDLVLNDVKEALLENFAFEARQFGQAVALSDVIYVMQQIDGVIAVDVDTLYINGEAQKLNTLLPCKVARYDNGQIQPAEILIINPDGIELVVMKE